MGILYISHLSLNCLSDIIIRKLLYYKLWDTTPGFMLLFLCGCFPGQLFVETSFAKSLLKRKRTTFPDCSNVVQLF